MPIAPLRASVIRFLGITLLGSTLACGDVTSPPADASSTSLVSSDGSIPGQYIIVAQWWMRSHSPLTIV